MQHILKEAACQRLVIRDHFIYNWPWWCSSGSFLLLWPPQGPANPCGQKHRKMGWCLRTGCLDHDTWGSHHRTGAPLLSCIFIHLIDVTACFNELSDDKSLNLAPGLLPWLLAVLRGSGWAAATVWCIWNEELIPISLPRLGRIINIPKLFLSSSDERQWKKGVSYLFHCFFHWAPLNDVAMTVTLKRDLVYLEEATLPVHISPLQPGPSGGTGDATSCSPLPNLPACILRGHQLVWLCRTARGTSHCQCAHQWCTVR